MIRYLNLSRFEDQLFGKDTPPQTHGYPRQAFVRALLLKQIMDLDYRELALFLRHYPAYRRACGFESGPVPHFTSFSKFFQKLDPDVMEEIVLTYTRKVLRKLKVPAKLLAIDSTLLRASCNSFDKKADPDARTGKSSTKGWYFGYKLHLVVDAHTELPVSWTVTPGNRYDGHEFLPLLRKSMRVVPRRPRAILADKGYDAGYNYAGAVDECGTIPIIDIRRQRRRRSGRQLSLDLFLSGKKVYQQNKTLNGRPMTKEQMLRHHPPIPRESPEWKTYRPFRMAVERVISRLKGWFGLERLWARTLKRVRKIIALTLLAWMGSALYLTRRGRPGLVRSFPYVL